MDKNQVIGWGLIILIVFGFIFYQSKVTLEEEKQKTETSKVEKVSEPSKNDTTFKALENGIGTSSNNGKSNSQLDSLRESIQNEELKGKYGIFANSVNGTSEEIVLENQHLKLTINTKGGYISKAILKKYRTYNDYIDNKKGELVLFSGDSNYYQLAFQHQNRTLNTRDFIFKASDKNITISEDNQSKSVKLRLLADNGGYIEYVYTLKSNDYLLDFNINIVDLDRDITGVNKGVEFQWEQVAPIQEKSLDLERQNATVFYYSAENGRDYLSERSAFDEESPEDNLDWISFKQQYFSSVIIAKSDKIKGSKVEVKYNETDSNYVKKFRTTFPIALSANVNQQYHLFLGPNDYDILESYDFNLQNQLNLGWGIFRWVNEYFIYPIFQFILQFGIGVGIAIILLTFIIKLVLFPITYKNYLSSAKMRIIKPHLDKLNEDNKNADPLKKQQAMMELYKKTGVNPLAGCIPALLQMPILIALYRLFPTAMELRHQPFLWADDLSSFDSIYTWSADYAIPFYGNHISLFTVLMSVSMFFYMRFNNQMTPTPSASGGGELQQAIQKNMKLMMNLMPFMMLFMFNSFAAGLSFYYFLANMITIGQTLSIKKFFINEESILSKINEHMTKPMQKSRWQKKLEEIQAKQKK